MSARFYRLLLRLLPRHRRERYGDEMASVFEAQALNGVGRRWVRPFRALSILIREVAGIVRFAWHSRRRGDPVSQSRYRGTTAGRLGADVRGALHSVRRRGSRGVLAAGLLGIALGASTVAFSVSDALVFRRAPYPEADRLVALPMMSGRMLSEWRRQTDLFADLHGYWERYVYVPYASGLERIESVYVTPGLIDMLGIQPRWGRSLTNADLADSTVEAALISSTLARRHFGDPARAIGGRIDTTDGPLMVVGVMPQGFRFPAGDQHVWKVLDARMPVIRAVKPVGRIAGQHHLTTLNEALAARSAQVAAGPLSGVTSRNRSVGTWMATPWVDTGAEDRSRQLTIAIVGAALCLLLSACANVANLELVGAMRRERDMAVQVALGSTRGSLARAALLEGAVLVALALVVATAAGAAGTSVVAGVLADDRFRSANPMDLDVRAVVFMIGAAMVTWLAVSLPLVVFASRTELGTLLRMDPRVGASPGGTRTYRLLTTGEVALAVCLLAGGALFTRTYLSLASLDKGFEARDLYGLTVTLPTGGPAAAPSADVLERAILALLRGRHGVQGVASTDWLPPNLGESYRASTFRVDGHTVEVPTASFGVHRVSAGFLEALGVRIIRGRGLLPEDREDVVVIGESLARRFPIGVDPIGRGFSLDDGGPSLTVVGVAAHVRVDRDGLAGPSPTHFLTFVPRVRRPPPPAVQQAVGSARPTALNDRPLSGAGLSFLLRLESGIGAHEIAAALRGIDHRFGIEIQSMDDIYAGRFGDRLLAMQTVGAFGLLAFVVALAGVYGTMAHLVATRTREIGLRVALGAKRADIRRLVLGSSIRLIVVGALLGIGLALLGSRWIAVHLFGVAATDPTTYAGVATAVAATTLLATWQPARQAARIDPAITLRAE